MGEGKREKVERKEKIYAKEILKRTNKSKKLKATFSVNINFPLEIILNDFAVHRERQEWEDGSNLRHSVVSIAPFFWTDFKEVLSRRKVLKMCYHNIVNIICGRGFIRQQAYECDRNMWLDTFSLWAPHNRCCTHESSHWKSHCNRNEIWDSVSHCRWNAIVQCINKAFIWFFALESAT